MSSEIIKKDLDEFQKAVKKLSTGVGKAGVLWKDKKYSELSNEVSNVANMSKDVIITGDKCCNTIDKFMKIASEKC